MLIALNRMGPSFGIMFCLLIIFCLLLKIIPPPLNRISISVFVVFLLLLFDLGKNSEQCEKIQLFPAALIAGKQSRGRPLISCHRAKSHGIMNFSLKVPLCFKQDFP